MQPEKLLKGLSEWLAGDKLPLNRRQKFILQPAHTYGPDQIFSRNAGKPSFCIPAILWGLQKQEVHGDHMRTVKENFRKANAAP